MVSSDAVIEISAPPQRDDVFLTVDGQITLPLTQRSLLTIRRADFDLPLIMKPDAWDAPSVVPYKSGARRRITEAGYTILAAVGDQQSDLEGGHALEVFKLPNPAYGID